MLAYRKSDFASLARHETVSGWLREATPSETIAKDLAQKFPSPFYMPNIFVRIGLFLFGSLCAGSVFGLFLLMTGFNNGSGEFGSELIFFGLFMLVGVEILIRRSQPFFRAGWEEALLYGGLLCLVYGILLVMEFKFDQSLTAVLLTMALLAVASWRYVDSLLGALSLACGFIALFHLSDSLGVRAGYVLPIIVILVSAWLVKVTGWALRQPELGAWELVWKVLRGSTLLTAYAGGNYFIVREMSQAMFHFSLAERQEIPLAFLFYVYTFALPLVYIGYGLARKERLFLNAGLLIFGMAVFTYKYYHHVLAVETGLCLAGLALLAIAWFALRFFRTPRFGISSAAPARIGRLLNAESLAQLATFTGPESAPQGPQGIQGAGGHFGGGGAEGGF